MRIFIYTLLFSFFATLSFSQKSESMLPSFLRKDIDSYMKKYMEAWSIPGAAVAVVKDGNIVYAKGFGSRHAIQNEAVDKNTMFMVASNTKAFTGALLATLDVEKKIDLDASIHEYLPDFHRSDSVVDKMLTPRDLLSHRTGTGTFQGDLTFWDTDYSKKDILKRYGKLENKSQFRTRFGYCNTCFLAAGEIIPAVTDTSWADMVRSRIFKPLGMNRSVALSSDFIKQDNIANAYTWYDNKLTEIPYCDVDNFDAAASIGASVTDMAKWLQMQLDTGRYEGHQILPRRAILETWRGNTLIRTGTHSSLPMHFWAYGLGLVVNDYAGHLMLSHTGGAEGFVTSTAFLPEEKLGIVVLTNTDNNSLFTAVRYQILDAFLKRKYVDHAARMLQYDLEDRDEEQKRIDDLRASVASKMKAELPLTEYTGMYNHPIYGAMRIRQAQGKLFADFYAHEGNTATLEPLGGNLFLATYSKISWGVFPMPFEVEDGKVKACSVKGNDFIERDSYRFEKL